MRPNIFSKGNETNIFSLKEMRLNIFLKGIATKHILQRKCEQQIFSKGNATNTFFLKELRPEINSFKKCDQTFSSLEMRANIISKGNATKHILQRNCEQKYLQFKIGLSGNKKFRSPIKLK